MNTAAAAATSAPPAPSEEQIALAWRHLRQRGGCPDTLEATRRHAIWGRALHGLAVNLSRRRGGGIGPAAAAAARLGGTGRYVPPDPTAPPRQRFPRLAGIDLKRAAANDHDDD